MAKKKELIWTKEYYLHALGSLDVKPPKTNDNTVLHKVLVDTLVERDAKASVDDRLSNLLEIAAAETTGVTKDQAPTAPEITSECVTFGKGYDPKADQCVNCEDGPEVAEKCKELTIEFKAAAKAKKGKKDSTPSKNVKKRYGSLDELKEHLKAAPDDQITMRLDKYIVLQKWTLATILKKLEEDRKELSTPEKEVRDFQSITRIKGHIRHRIKNNHLCKKEKRFRQHNGVAGALVQLIGLPRS